MHASEAHILAILKQRSLQRVVLLAIARGRRSRVAWGDVDTMAAMDAHVAVHNAVLAEIEEIRQEVLGDNTGEGAAHV